MTEDEDEDDETAAAADFTGQKIVFSGFRSARLEAEIKRLGGSVTESVSSKTSLVITKDRDSTSGKTEKAKTLGIEILTLDDFIRKYGLRAD